MERSVRFTTPVISKIAVVVSLIGLLFWALWPAYRLEVSSEGRPDAFLSLPVSSGDRFSIRFLHSYDRAFLQENYEIEHRAKIVLRDMTFQSHLNGGGFAYPNFHLRADGVGELRDINEARKKIQFMMGSRDLANHKLIFKGETFHLSDGIEPFEIVEIKLKKRMVLWDLFEKVTSSP
ncbi:MAG: DUF1850 domain-containing protein [Deltaproteobacteria bacterium]|nr:DUF1850 domain-containing protein [Deltaproteobacteria bacterium]